VVGTKDSLQPGACASAFITVDTADDAPCGFTFTNRVQAGSSKITSDIVFNESNFVPEDDSDPSNNSAEFVTTVACPNVDEDGKDDGAGGGGRAWVRATAACWMVVPRWPAGSLDCSAWSLGDPWWCLRGLPPGPLEPTATPDLVIGRAPSGALHFCLWDL
jgi:hypothetical protein